MAVHGNAAERIGERLIRIGAITKGQVETVLKKQEDGDNRLFGEIAIELRYVIDRAISDYLESKY